MMAQIRRICWVFRFMQGHKAGTLVWIRRIRWFFKLYGQLWPKMADWRRPWIGRCVLCTLWTYLCQSCPSSGVKEHGKFFSLSAWTRMEEKQMLKKIQPSSHVLVHHDPQLITSSHPVPKGMGGGACEVPINKEESLDSLQQCVFLWL